MIYLTNLMKWRTLCSQMNVIINPNSQQHAEMSLRRSTHVNDNSSCGTTVNGAAVYLFDKFISIGTHIIHSVPVHSKISFKCFVFLQQALKNKSRIKKLKTQAKKKTNSNMKVRPSSSHNQLNVVYFFTPAQLPEYHRNPHFRPGSVSH